MTTLSRTTAIEDLQRQGKAPSRVVAIKPGQEGAAARLASLSAADVVPFQLNGDQMYLVGRGLTLRGVHEGKSVSFQGKTGVVNGETRDRPNSFLEGATHKGVAFAATATFGLGIAAGAVCYLLAPLPVTFFLPVALGGLAALGVAGLGGLGTALRPVDLKAFSQVAK